MNEQIRQAKALSAAAIKAVAEYVNMLEPGMPIEERERLAEGTLAMLCEWSTEHKPLPNSVNEWLSLPPWKDIGAKITAAENNQMAEEMKDDWIG